MFIGASRFEFLVTGSTSLKEKRRVVQHIVGKMRAKFNASIAEVEHQDLQRRCTIGVSCVSGSASHVQNMLDEMERYVRSQYEIEVLNVDAEVIKPDA